ncbi:MAG: ATPase [Pseudomonadota bacterium]
MESQDYPGNGASGLHASPSFLVILMLLSTIAATVRAEVLDAAPGGFSTQSVLETPRSRIEVFDAFVNNIGAWWNPDHTVSGTAEALYLEPRPMGCFCESLGSGAGLVHMTVTFVNPGVLLRLSGGLGPLGLLGTSGNMTIEFEDVDVGTRVTLRYVVGGYAPDGLASLAGPVDSVLGDQLRRFGIFLEQNPAP